MRAGSNESSCQILDDIKAKIAANAKDIEVLANLFHELVEQSLSESEVVDQDLVISALNCIFQQYSHFPLYCHPETLQLLQSRHNNDKCQRIRHALMQQQLKADFSPVYHAGPCALQSYHAYVLTSPALVTGLQKPALMSYLHSIKAASQQARGFSSTAGKLSGYYDRHSLVAYSNDAQVGAGANGGVYNVAFEYRVAAVIDDVCKTPLYSAAMPRVIKVSLQITDAEAELTQRYLYGRRYNVPALNPAITMQKAAGESLDSLIERGAIKRLPYLQRYQLAIAMMTLVDKMHQAGFLHLDLKPDQFQVEIRHRQLQTVTLLDYGMSLALDDNGVAEGQFACGTPAYISPECRWDSPERIYSAKSDVYAMGVTLVEVLSGEFFSQCDQEAEDDKMNEDCRQEVYDCLPENLRNMLEQEPSKRPGTAEVLQVLRENRATLAPEYFLHYQLSQLQYNISPEISNSSARNDLQSSWQSLQQALAVEKTLCIDQLQSLADEFTFAAIAAMQQEKDPAEQKALADLVGCISAAFASCEEMFATSLRPLKDVIVIEIDPLAEDMNLLNKQLLSNLLQKSGREHWRKYREAKPHSYYAKQSGQHFEIRLTHSLVRLQVGKQARFYVLPAQQKQQHLFSTVRDCSVYLAVVNESLERHDGKPRRWHALKKSSALPCDFSQYAGKEYAVLTALKQSEGAMIRVSSDKFGIFSKGTQCEGLQQYCQRRAAELTSGNRLALMQGLFQAMTKLSSRQVMHYDLTLGKFAIDANDVILLTDLSAAMPMGQPVAESMLSVALRQSLPESSFRLLTHSGQHGLYDGQFVVLDSAQANTLLLSQFVALSLEIIAPGMSVAELTSQDKMHVIQQSALNVAPIEKAQQLVLLLKQAVTPLKQLLQGQGKMVSGMQMQRAIESVCSPVVSRMSNHL